MNLLLRLGAGVLASSAIAAAAYRRGSLTRSGIAGGLVVGTVIFAFGGWPWWLVLVAFFITSSRLSHYREASKERIAAEKFSKGSQRDLGQALANGGMGALMALASFFAPGPVTMAAFVGAMAAVNGDTWATELGVLSTQPPRLVTTWKVVEPGTSGGVTGRGLLAAFGGSLVIGVAALGSGAIERLFGGASMPPSPWLLVAAAAGGMAGTMLDSALGATVQAVYRCPKCRKETERTLHSCGTPTEPARGWRWLDNEWVNFIGSFGGAAVGALVGAVL